MLTTITSRDFNQDTAAAKRAAANGPVVITDRGQPAHVLLTYERYQELSGATMSALDCLAAPPEVAEIDFEIAPLDWQIQPADLG